MVVINESTVELELLPRERLDVLAFLVSIEPDIRVTFYVNSSLGSTHVQRMSKHDEIKSNQVKF